MKKVVLCIPTLGTGGAEKFVVDLASRFPRDRFQVMVAITRKRTDGIFVRALNDMGVPIADLSGPNYLVMLKNQLRFLRREKPDVLHVNIGSILHLLLATALVRVPKKLYTVHNEPKLLYNGRKIKKLLYAWAFRFGGYIPVGISPAIKEQICEDFKLERDRVAMVQNGVDIVRFTPASSERASDPVTIISTGTLYAIKNQKQIIRVFCDLHRKYPQTKLVLLGDGPMRNELEQMVSDMGSQGDIEFPGIQKNVPDFLRNADIYVSASLTEGLPLSILEAMACGLPVVATAVGGTVDIVCDNTNGFTVPKEDPLKMQEALEELIVSKEKRTEFGKASRRIAESWSLDACAEGYERLYNGV